jgi:hypothetical protein
MLLRDHVCSADASHQIRIIYGLLSPEPWVLKSATNLLFRFVAAITDSCIKLAMKRHGGTTCISMHWRLPRDFGRRPGRRHFQPRLKHLNNKRLRIHSKRPHLRMRANYRTNPIDATKHAMASEEQFQPIDAPLPKAQAQ